MGTTGSNSSTSSILLPDPTNGSPMTVIIIVIIFLLVAIFVIAIIVIVILLLLRWRKQKRKGGYNSTVSMQVIVAKANNDTNLCGKQKTAEYDVVNKDKLYSTPSKDMSRKSNEEASSKNPLSEESGPIDAGVCDDGTYDSSIDIDIKPDIYNTLSQGHAAENVISNSTYSKHGYATGGSYFSSPNTNLDKTSSTSLSHIYSSVTRPDERPAKSKCTQDLWSDETGEEVLRYPEKNQELQKLLNVKLLDEAPHEDKSAVDVEIDTYSFPNYSTNKISTLTRPAISAGSLSNNPLYFSTKKEMGSSVTENTITDIVYAEPGVSIAAEMCMFQSLENIYESIYSEALQPSHFMQEPEDTENINDLCPYQSIYTVPVIPTTQGKALEVTMENIEEDVLLGSGNFGSVILAHTVGLSHYDLKIGKSTDKTISVPVAVKMLKDGADESAKEQFEKEYRFMFRLNHPNVIRLLGICMTETSFIMMEYMENGDLNQVLQDQYHTIVDDEMIPGEGEITQQMLIYICTQIASAMDYLTSNNFVHRDLATRNCLVGENFCVKVSDFGMSRNLYESHYYIIRGHAILPIRWMAMECFCGKFSAKSDVWAFGITMWEIFMLAKEEPYSEMSDRDLVQNAIRRSERLLLSCPEGCPHNVYEIMNCCWAHKASQRATFEQLHEKLLLL